MNTDDEKKATYTNKPLNILDEAQQVIHIPIISLNCINSSLYEKTVQEHYVFNRDGLA